MRADRPGHLTYAWGCITSPKPADAISHPNAYGLEMDRQSYQHEHRADCTPAEMPVSALRHHLTFLMSYPIWGKGTRPKKSRSPVADAILFLASGSDPAAAKQVTEPGAYVRVFAPYVIKRKNGQRNVQTLSVSRNVTFHDLDLTSSGDAAVLEQRIIQATQDVCREVDSRYGSGNWNRIAEDCFGARHASVKALAEIQTLTGAAGTN